MAQFWSIRKLFVTLGILVIIVVGLLTTIGILAAESMKGPPTYPPPPYVTPDPGNPCVIPPHDLLHFSESIVSRDVNNVASRITIHHNSTRLLDVPSSALKGRPYRLLDVPSSALEGPTIAALQPLYENYKAAVGVQDDWGPQHVAEKDAFLDAIMDTTVMKFTELWMTDRCLLDDYDDLRSLLDKAWFIPYAGPHSDGANDTSGFEHTFMGQLEKDYALGMNNWIFYYHEQQAGTIIYKEDGYRNSTQFGEGKSNKGEIIKLNFLWHDLPHHHRDFMFIGTSPELELALYTVCFRMMPGKHCPLKMQGQRFEVLTMDYLGMGVIAVAKPLLYS